MKKNHDDVYENTFIRKLLPRRIRRGPFLASLGAFLVSLLFILGGQGYLHFNAGNFEEFEAGRVAGRDVIAGKSLSWVDEAATAVRRAEEVRRVPAVFTYSNRTTGEIREKYGRFAAALGKAFAETATFEDFYARIEEGYPGFYSSETLLYLYRDQNRERFPEYSLAALEYLLETGIFALPESGLEAYNGKEAQLWHNYGPRTEREIIDYDRIITLDRADDMIVRYAAENGFPLSFEFIAPSLLEPFLQANVFYSGPDTENFAAEQRARVDPVIRRVERGQRVIRQGFVITPEAMGDLAALNAARSRLDIPGISGKILVMLFAYGLLVFLAGERTLGRILRPGEVYLLSVVAALYLAAAVFCRGLSRAEDFPVALFLPTPMAVMIPAILISFRAAFAAAITLPLTAFLAGAFTPGGYIFALASAVVTAWTLRGAERRLDLLKAGVVIGAANAVTAASLLLLYRLNTVSWPLSILVAALNGVISAMLTLGTLPFLEHALNAVTNFRLIELADLNTPVLKRLFDAAPGTYSHSLMVANLAENACQAIGANPLLARVGAYYHDIGKMENPAYFVENQTLYNKHTEMNNPRLSATVIRSHVKLGVEKARSLGLPQEVVAIVAEHHGNSLITYFYAAALKREGQVNREDFSYPGNPPRSRESAVVMLADVTEAACRTLKKPTASRLEKFIQELVMAKFDHEQLADSELTFRELDTIKKAFVRVLTGYYHSRIEYPKVKDKIPAAETAAPAAGNGAAGERAGA
ncbi:MAG: HDIG domain-containing protein [Spirochaetaceae bacterium]|jgi:putative nucleotidyltransferase with HDIG domain|nr:HDIG domain-containing protein [Spirochaetaceae bacterium]